MVRAAARVKRYSSTLMVSDWGDGKNFARDCIPAEMSTPVADWKRWAKLQVIRPALQPSSAMDLMAGSN